MRRVMVRIIARARFALGVGACVAACARAPLTPASLTGSQGLTRDDLVHAATGQERIALVAAQCARIASCAHGHDEPRFREPGACVEYWLDHLDDQEDPIPECLWGARSCTDVGTCLHGSTNERASAFCAAHPGVSSACDGNALIVCTKDDPSESTLTACDARHATCGEVHSAGGLMERACLSPASCSLDISGSHCDGAGDIVTCNDTVLERIPCRLGTICHDHEDADGEALATCEGPAEVACDAVGQRACQQDTLVRCEAHGHHGRQVAVECAGLGLSCGPVAGRAMCFARSSSHEPCGKYAPRCDHHALLFCAAGELERVDCKALGLGPCEADSDGPFARCGAAHATERKGASP